MLLENQAQWKAKQRLKWERIVAKQEQMDAKRDQWAAKCAECAKWSTVGPTLNIYKMVDPVRYCGGVKELDWFLDALRLNFNSQGHLFPRGGPDHIKYVISLPDAWSNHQNLPLRQTAMTDPFEWDGDLSEDSDPCLQYFEICLHEMAHVHGDKDWWRVAVITPMHGC